MQGNNQCDKYNIKEEPYMNMHKVDFSNIFSPKSQKAISKRKGSLSSQFSPVKFKVQREFVTNLPTVQGFRKMTKMRLSDNNVQNILATLDIEAKANLQNELRAKTNKLYLQYTHNPLTMVDLVGPSPYKQGSILTAIENINKRDPSAQIKARIVPTKSEINELCMRLKKRIQKTMRRVKQQSSQKMTAFKHPDATAQIPIKTPFEQLDDITTLKDDYFFAKYYATKQLDIFQLIEPKNRSKFKSNREILGGYYFCNDSIWLPTTSSHKKVANKFYMNHLECISSFSRQMARGVTSKSWPEKLVLGEGDIAFNLQELHFQDIMLIASNKLTSLALYKYFKGEEEDMQKKVKDSANIEQIDSPSIIYAHNTRNRCDNFDPVDQDKTEIEYFHKSPFINVEQRQQKLSKSYHAKLKKTIEDETIVIANTIKDRKVMASFKKSKEKTLVQHLQGNVDNRLALLMKQVERKIRMNKMNKNRTEKIKIDSLTMSLRMKRALEISLSKSKQKKDGRFSPLKTWRS